MFCGCWTHWNFTFFTLTVTELSHGWVTLLRSHTKDIRLRKGNIWLFSIEFNSLECLSTELNRTLRSSLSSYTHLKCTKLKIKLTSTRSSPIMKVCWCSWCKSLWCFIDETCRTHFIIISTKCSNWITSWFCCWAFIWWWTRKFSLANFFYRNRNRREKSEKKCHSIFVRKTLTSYRKKHHRRRLHRQQINLDMFLCCLLMELFAHSYTLRSCCIPEY